MPPKEDFPSGWDVTEIGPEERAPAADKLTPKFNALGYSPVSCKDPFIALLNFSGLWSSKEMRGELVAELSGSQAADSDALQRVAILKNLEASAVEPFQSMASACSSFRITGTPRGDFTANVSKIQLSGAQADKVFGVTLRFEDTPMLSLIIAKVRGVYVIADCSGDTEAETIKLASTTVNNLSKI